MSAPRPVAVTTLITTDVGPDSLHVGSMIGSPAASGGLKAGLGTFLSLRTTSPDAIELTPGVPTVVTNRLYNNSGNLYFNGAPLATGSSLSGAINTVAVFTGPSTVGNSVITQGAGLVNVASALQVQGNFAAYGTGAFRDGLYAGPSNVRIIAADGRIPAINTTYFADLSAAALTGVTAVTLAAGTHTGQYTFNNAANAYAGTGYYLLNLNASELLYGTVPDGRIAGQYNQVIILANPANQYNGAAFNGSHNGSGAGLTSIPAAQLVGVVPTAALPPTTLYSLGLTGDVRFTDLVGAGPTPISFIGGAANFNSGTQSGWIGVRDQLNRKLWIPFWFSAG